MPNQQPTRAELVEMMAKAIDNQEPSGISWANTCEQWKQTCRSQAAAALTALCAHDAEIKEIVERKYGK